MTENVEATEQDFLKLLQVEENLDFELVLYVETDAAVPMIRHPLVYSIPHTPAMNAMVNLRLRQKKAACSVALENGEFDEYVWLHERPHRLAAMEVVADDMSDPGYWRLLRAIWVDSENIGQNAERWGSFLRSQRQSRSEMMTAGEAAALAAMPDNVEVFRGVGSETESDHGWSWTLNRETAEWFARRFAALSERAGCPSVKSATVSKSDVVAYMGSRGEEEVLIAPEKTAAATSQRLP
jgi:hypothetical protein